MPKPAATTLIAGLPVRAPAAALLRITALAARLPGAAAGVVSLLGADGGWTVIGRDGAAEAGPHDASGHALARHVAAEGVPVVLADPAADPRFAGDGLLRDTPHRFYAGAPIMLADGRCGGVLAVLGPLPQAQPDAAATAGLADLAWLAGEAVARETQLADLATQARRAELTSRSLALVAGSGGFHEAFQATLTLLCTHFGAVLGRVWQLKPHENLMREICHYSATDALEGYFDFSNTVELSPDNSNVARAIVTGQAQTVHMADLAAAGGLPLVDRLIRRGMVCQVIQPVRYLEERLAVALMFDTGRDDLSSIAADVAALLEVLHTAIYRKVTEEQTLLLTSALDRAGDAVLITEAAPLDEPGPRIVYANAAFCRNTGYELAEVLGRSPRFLQGAGTDPAVVAALGQRLRLQQAARVELLNYRKDGSTFPAELDIVPLTDADEKVTHFVSLQRDLTDRKRAEQAAFQAQKLQTIGQITGGVAHDFNNLLAIISGNLELLADALMGREDLREELQAALRATDRGAILTRSLLSFARQQPLEPRRVDVAELAGDMVQLLRRTVPESIDVRLSIAEGLWDCEADPSQLQNGLLNLVVNARDAMPRGGRLTIEAENRVLDADYAAANIDLEVVAGDYVMLAVSDTGTGMTPEVAARAFEPFFTTKAHDKGTGLGLSMVYGFAKQSGGHVSIYSEPGQGTTVRLYLPRCRRSEADRPAAPEPAAPLAPGVVTVLVVEDNDDVRQLTSLLLKSLGYAVVGAESASRALEIVAERDDVALMLTDIVLAGDMDGARLAKAVGRLRPDMRIVYMSGYTENAVLHHGRLDPGVSLLQKPFRRQELADKIAAALRG